jgi:glycosyltransferase involved in cell wall biosynthesis
VTPTNLQNALVSVIIPTYNRAPLLRAAVESVLAQTYPLVEIIVVDDGSTDSTAQAMGAYVGRVKYIRQENAGVSAARNRGFHESTGEFVGFLDDDDIYFPEKIARQVSCLIEMKGCPFVHCRYLLMNEAGQYLNRIGLLPEGNIFGELLCRNFLWMSAPLIRRDCLEQVGGFDETLSTAADYDLWLRLARLGWLGCVQQPLGAYRIQRGSMVTNMARTEQEVIAVLERIFADPRLPPAFARVKPQAYAQWRFWFACRYYAARLWDDAQRNLTQALSLDPLMLEKPEIIVEGFYSEAMDERVDDAFAYIQDVYDHLPPTAGAIRPFFRDLQRRIHLGQAFRLYGGKALDKASDYLANTVGLYPEVLRQPEEFVRLAVDNAMCLPLDPLAYIQTVFSHLPDEARSLVSSKGRVTSSVRVARAFEAYHNRHYRSAIGMMLRALLRQPTRLINRGVAALLVKSLLGWLPVR